MVEAIPYRNEIVVAINGIIVVPFQKIVETGFKLMITCSDIMITYQLSQKLKLLGNDEFNHSTIILT